MATNETHSTEGAVKFTFNKVFNAEGDLLFAPKTAWTEDEVEEIRKTAFDEGHTDALTSAETQNREAATAAAEQLASLCDKVMTDARNNISQLQADAANLAHLAARKLAGTVLDQYPDATVTGVLNECLSYLNREPRITLRIPARVETHLRPIIEAAIGQRGMEKQILIIADDSMSASDCAIEWSDGGIEKNQKDIENEIARIISGFANKTEAPPAENQTTTDPINGPGTATPEDSQNV